jgi:hypothetical protein
MEVKKLMRKISFKLHRFKDDLLIIKKRKTQKVKYLHIKKMLKMLNHKIRLKSKIKILLK